MEESILNSVKKVLGIPPTQTAFDSDIIMHINSALSVMSQIGVGPSSGFMIAGHEETWGQFIGADSILNMVKTCVFLMVKLVFDPPGTSFHLAAMKEQIQEHQVRIQAHLEGVKYPWPPTLTTSSTES